MAGEPSSPSGRIARESRFADPDAAYRLLVEAHRGLDEEQSKALNAALVLTLANHVGDIDALADAIALAKASLAAPQGGDGRSSGPPGRQ